MPRESAVAEHVTIVASNGENRDARAARLQWHNGPLLRGKRASGAQEFQIIAFAPLQFIAQLRRQRASGSIASQPIAIGRDMNIAVAKSRKEGGYLHSTTSSRTPT